MTFAALLENGFVLIHVLFGLVALIMAPIAMRTQKGGRQHRRWGKVYFWGMFGIFVTALALLYFRPNLFLFIISIFSFYGALTGYRSLYRKQAGQAAMLDWSSSTVALVAGAGFVIWGGLTASGLLDRGYPPGFGYLGIGFGGSLLLDAIHDLRSYVNHPQDRRWWWYYHIERMSGSYIAAVTAFAVQNLTRILPIQYGWIVWILPALIGIPLINLTVRRYRRQFENASTRPAKSSQPA